MENVGDGVGLNSVAPIECFNWIHSSPAEFVHDAEESVECAQVSFPEARPPRPSSLRTYVSPSQSPLGALATTQERQPSNLSPRRSNAPLSLSADGSVTSPSSLATPPARPIPPSLPRTPRRRFCFSHVRHPTSAPLFMRPRGRRIVSPRTPSNAPRSARAITLAPRARNMRSTYICTSTAPRPRPAGVDSAPRPGGPRALLAAIREAQRRPLRAAGAAVPDASLQVP
ncbi:hypothetical protein BDY21DRAFT_139907 [Lineolata rhizophorae]|uniref:Uncharacterized protein n=1 Tax=Lineolata rhizophorae TaxID=578093 RepID=A0A6A6PB30_9PEZI|nr:hypothetical protein BDY21DRAFT_139907 [Lineolata rhizophorae]